MLVSVARDQARPTPPPVMQVAASITSRRHDAGPTVLDERRWFHAQDSTASPGGDVVGTHQIPMPVESAVCADEPATLGFGDALPADRAGGGGATLVHQVNPDAREFGLVAQRLHQMGAAPLPQPEILYATDVVAGDALRVTDHQGANLAAAGKGNHQGGGLMVDLMDPTAMASFCAALLGPVAPPPA
jgi:hypothetical protein